MMGATNAGILVPSVFRKVFAKQLKKDARIVLYGLGAITGAVVSAFPKGTFLGLLDGFQTEGEMYGLPILTLDKAKEKGCEQIVIIARAQSVHIIANRIRKYCRTQGISLWDMDGNDLLADVKQSFTNHPYFALSMGRVRKAIRFHEIISFDVFDTLLMRRTFYPTDVFYLLEHREGIQNFAKFRMGAELALSREMRQPTLLDVYTRMADMAVFPDGMAEQLMEAEIALEKEFLVPRRDVVALFHYALAQGKQVYVVSDMYLSKDVLEEILIVNGIDGFAGMYVSSEYGTGKCGALFSIFQNEVVGNSYLHLGDSFDADVKSAEDHGIDAIELKSALALAELTEWKSVEAECETLEERLRYGQVLAEMLNSPFVLHTAKGRAQVHSAYISALQSQS